MEEFAGIASLKLSGQTFNVEKHILPCFYLPPVIYFALAREYGEFELEIHEHYTKQTFRNRSVILGANGTQVLSIPVIKKSGSKQLVKDIEIDYSTPWQKLHWKSIESAYANSPYYEYYMDDLIPFYEKKTKFLADLNEALLYLCLRYTGLNFSFKRSKEFIPVGKMDDPRYFLSPKRNIEAENSWFRPEAYNQVFSDRFGFVPNLSILDLIFNIGPEAGVYIIKSKKG